MAEAWSEEDAAHVERILDLRNFYEILNVSHNASEGEIKSAYKTLSLLVHPDKNNHPRAKEAFCALRKASAVLLDKGKRNEYDNYLSSPHGLGKEKFDLSEEAVDAILISAGVLSAIGIAAAIWSLVNWFTESRRSKRESR